MLSMYRNFELLAGNKIRYFFALFLCCSPVLIGSCVSKGLSTILLDFILGLFVAPDNLVLSEWLVEKNAAVQETLHSWMDCKDCKKAAVQENPTQLVQI